MFSPEDTVTGFVAGISGRVIDEVLPSSRLYSDLGVDAHAKELLARMVASEYGLMPSPLDVARWAKVQDVIDWCNQTSDLSQPDSNFGADMVPEVEA